MAPDMPTNLVPWNRRRWATHSLSVLENLSAGADRLLLISERTLHVLQNLAVEEMVNPGRYTVEETPGGYRSVDQLDAEWPLFVAVTEALQLELAGEGTMTIEQQLDDILTQMQAHPPMVFEATLAINASNPNANAGNNTLQVYLVPEAVTVELQAATALNSTTVPSRVDLMLQKGTGETVYIASRVPASTLDWTVWTGRVVMRDGDRIVAQFLSCAAGDDLFGRVWLARVKD